MKKIVLTALVSLFAASLACLSAGALDDAQSRVLLKEDFESFATGVGAETSSERLALSETADDAELYFYMGDYTTPFSVEVDPLDYDNVALCLYNEGVKMVEIDKTRNAFALDYSAPGKYVFKSRIMIPAESNVSEAIMSVVTDASGANGYQFGNVTVKDTWVDCYRELIIGESEKDTVVKAVKFWNWPSAEGEIWVDDVEVDYYPVKVTFYADESKADVLFYDYAAQDVRFELPLTNAFAASVPAGKYLVGLNIAGKVYGFDDVYVPSSADIEEEGIAAYPVYSDVKPSVMLSESFENQKPFAGGPCTSDATALIIGNVPTGTLYRFYTIGGWSTPNARVMTDPLDANNRAFRIDGASVKYFSVLPYRANDASLGFDASGKYVFTARVLLPEDSGVNELAWRVDSNAGNKSGSVTAKGAWQTISYEMLIGGEGEPASVKTFSVYDWPSNQNGPFWVDDIKIEYFPVKVEIYADAAKSTLLKTDYGCVGERFELPMTSAFAASIPSGKYLAGLDVAGKTYGFSDAYTLDAADVKDGVLTISPVFADEMPSVILSETFENQKLNAGGPCTSDDTALIIGNVPTGTTYHFYTIGGYSTPNARVMVDPFDPNNRAFRIDGKSVKYFSVLPYRANAASLGFDKPGKYVFSAKVMLPEDSGVNNLTWRVDSNANNKSGSFTAKGVWQTISCEMLIGGDGQPASVKTFSFYDWPTDQNGPFWVDDIKIEYLPFKVEIYADAEKTTLLATDYGAEGQRFELPATGTFAASIPSGKYIVGLDIAGKTYSFDEAYTLNAADAKDGVITVSPVFTDEMPSVFLSETFENQKLNAGGACTSDETALIIGNVPTGTTYRFYTIGGYSTPNARVLPDPLDPTNRAFRIDGKSVKYFSVLPYRANAASLGFDKPGKYVFSARVMLPEDSGVNSLTWRVDTDSSNKTDTVSKKGTWQTIRYEQIIGEEDAPASVKTFSFYDWPTDQNGPFWVDDIKIEYFPIIDEETVSVFYFDGDTQLWQDTDIVVGETHYLRETVPTKSGMTFLGWALSKDSGVVTLAPGDDVILDTDLTLYAVWKEAAPVTLTSVSILDAAHQPVDTIPEGAFYAEAAVTNVSYTGTMTLIFVSYDADGRMLNTHYLYTAMPAGQTFGVGQSFSNADGDIAGIRVFVWDTFDGMKPLSDAVSFTD